MTSALAVALAEAGPDVVRQLLRQHGADDSGRCRSCRKDGFAPTFPCPLADAAQAAAAQLLFPDRRAT